MKKYEIIGAGEIGPLHDVSGIYAKGNEQMQVSDGFHTMDELYEHRIELFITLCRALSVMDQVGRDMQMKTRFEIWRAKQHADGTMFEGWFIMGIGRNKGEQITYHLPMSKWPETEFAQTLVTAPEWDGHTPKDTLERLKKI